MFKCKSIVIIKTKLQRKKPSKVNNCPFFTPRENNTSGSKTYLASITYISYPANVFK